MQGAHMSTRILVVDDEPSIIDVLRYNLEKAHYQVFVAYDGEQALDIAHNREPDLIVLDLMLPGLDGLEVCRQLWKKSEIPIIMLTARDEEVDRVVGLELGADDYVVKPFSMRELLARIKTVLRRVQSPASTPDQRLQLGNLRLDPDQHLASWKDHQLALSAQEFDLLHTFLRHPGQVLSRDQLLAQVWGYDDPGDTRTVDSALKRLRAKLRAVDPAAAEGLITVRGVGYKLDHGE